MAQEVTQTKLLTNPDECEDLSKKEDSMTKLFKKKQSEDERKKEKIGWKIGKGREEKRPLLDTVVPGIGEKVHP